MRSVHPAPQPPAIDSSAVAPSGHPWHAWVAGVIYLACLAAFVGDLTHDITWAYGVLYIPLVCTAVFYRDPDTVWWLAAIAITLVILGCMFPVVDFGIRSLVNRALPICAILTAAALVRLARSMRDRLEQVTLRA